MKHVARWSSLALVPLMMVACSKPANSAPAAGPKKTIATFAGTGTKGMTGDGGPANAATLNNVFGIVRGPDGALYICDTDNHAIRKVDKEGKISTVAGTGKKGYAGDGGPATAALLNEPYEVRFDAAGNLLFVERLNHCVRKVDGKTGVISTVAGQGGKNGYAGDGGPATEALFNQPHSIQLDKAGNLYICDILNHRVRVVDAKDGKVSTFAGTGKPLPTTEGAKFAETPLRGPRAIDFDADGNMWLALREGNALYKLDLKSGTIYHKAGQPGAKAGFTGNGGPAKQAVLAGPKGVSVAPDGKIYLADTESHSIRFYDPATDTLQLLAGTGKKGDGPDGTDSHACQLNRPHGVFVDADGSVYIGDSENHRVRVVKP